MIVGRDYLHPGEVYAWAGGGHACAGGGLVAHFIYRPKPSPTYLELCKAAFRARILSARAAEAI